MHFSHIWIGESLCYSVIQESDLMVSPFPSRRREKPEGRAMPLGVLYSGPLCRLTDLILVISPYTVLPSSGLSRGCSQHRYSAEL